MRVLITILRISNSLNNIYCNKTNFSNITLNTINKINKYSEVKFFLNNELYYFCDEINFFLNLPISLNNLLKFNN